MKKIVKFISLCLAFTMVLSLASCSKSPSNSSTTNPNTSGADSSAKQPVSDAGGYDLNQVSERTLTFAHTGAAGSANEFWGDEMKKSIEEKSGGKITVEVYGASQLGSDVSICNDLQSGAIDLQVCSPAALVTIIPEAAVFDMPFLFSDVESGRKALDNEEFFVAMKEAYDKAGLTLLTLYDQQFRELTSNKNITSYEDLSGLSLRTMNNKHHIAFWSAMNCLPTPLDTADIFLALQQGMLDGQENPYGQIVDKKMYEVQTYVTNSNHIFYVGDVFMSKITFDSLNDVEKQIIQDSADEVKDAASEFVDKTTEEALDKLSSEYGMTFIDFDQIPGIREKMAEATHDVAYKSISEAIGSELLDKWIAAAG